MHATDIAGGAKHGLQWRFVLSVFTPTRLTAGHVHQGYQPHEQK